MNDKLNLESIRLLREKTGAGLMDCRQALTAAAGDIQLALAVLREKGFEAAARKSERVAVEGIAHAAVFGERAVLLEVNTETDFAAGNTMFANGVARIAAAIARANPVDLAALLACPADGEEATVGDLLQKMILTFRENIVIRRFVTLTGTWPFAYMHQNGKFGVILSLEVTAAGDGGHSAGAGGEKPLAASELTTEWWDRLNQLGIELAMQIAAMAPRFVSREALGEAGQRDIQVQIEAEIAADEQLQRKPDAVRTRIAAGRLEKHFATFGLLDQPYMRDDTLTVRAWLEQTTAGWPIHIGISGFSRYARGEGAGGAEASAAEYARQLAGR